MKQVWIDIKFWMQQNAPHLLNYLNAPASIEEIEDVENKLDIKFSNDFKEFYMIHNGQTDESEKLVYSHAILSLKRIVDEWKVWADLLDREFDFDEEPITSDPDLGVKNDWWNIKWIPVTSNGCGDNFCIDMDPDKGGKVGQIISMWHDAVRRQIKAKSFGDWMIQYANDVSEGKYVYEDKLGIWKKD